MGIVGAIVVGALLLFAVQREFGPFGLDRRDRRILRAGRSWHGLRSYTGRVSSASRRGLRTTFFLTGADRTEQEVNVTDVDLVLRDGQAASAVWAIPKGRSRGRYIMFRNHTTDQVQYVLPAVSDILRARGWVLSFLVLLELVFITEAVGESLTTWQHWVLWGVAELFGDIVALPFLAIVGLCARIATNRRVSRFTRGGARSLIDQLDAAAEAPTTAPVTVDRQVAAMPSTP